VRRLPPQQAGLSVRHTPSGRRPWFVVSAAISGAQERLSAGDIDDERIGASRRRVDIASFFQSAIVSPYLVRDGPSVRFGPTGETLAEIRDRVLPIGAVRNGVRITSDNTRVPLYTRTPGWVVLGVRTGIPVRDNCSLSFGVENLLDRNYRGHGSGVDGAGRSAFAGVEFRF
jgi:outer membrane receptor protein involved in Fe transport